MEYGSDFDLAVCIGGDGTLNEVVTGLARGHIDVELGYIPTGSTNDFAVCHELSFDVMTAAENIVKGETRRFDLGKFGDRYFSYVAAFGAFSGLSYTTPQNLKNVFGHSAYFFDAMLVLGGLGLLRQHLMPLDLAHDGQAVDRRRRRRAEFLDLIDFFIFHGPSVAETAIKIPEPYAQGLFFYLAV